MSTVMVEISARHVHLCQKDLDILFGEGYVLTPKKDLSQPGQYACEERVAVVGPKRSIEGVSILGPLRSQTQVELSLTDARSVGIAAPVRESGVLDGTPGCTLVGPAGQVELESGVIAAKRHIHLDPQSAEKLGVRDQQQVTVKIPGTGRGLVFGDVVIRVNPAYLPAMHIDTDEANAAGASGTVDGEIIVQ